MGREKAPVLQFVLFAIFCMVFAGWLLVTLGNITLFADRATYTARFDDVTGLLPNDDVKISGVKVGKVTGLRVDDGGAALVDFTVDNSVALPDDSLVQVRWRDAFGLRFLYVIPGESSTLVQPSGDGTPDFQLGQTRSPTSIGVFLSRATPFVDALDPSMQNEVLRALRDAIVGREGDIQELVTDAALLLETLASRDEELGRTLTNTAILFDEYAQRDDDIRAVIDSLVDITDTLARRNATLESAVTALADLQGEFGTLIEASEDDLRLALDSLETITATLEENSDQLDLALSRSVGIIGYHRVSRLGQWFDVRAVGVSSNYQPLDSERGAELPDRDGGQSSDTSSNASSLFLAPLGLGGVR
jgi:phospholipid/cholesterol/gamma-HCH transport system substrate-binding protein